MFFKRSAKALVSALLSASILLSGCNELSTKPYTSGTADKPPAFTDTTDKPTSDSTTATIPEPVETTRPITTAPQVTQKPDFTYSDKRFDDVRRVVTANLSLDDLAIKGTYDRAKALEYAEKNWSFGGALCAEFITLCLKAGGLDIYETSSTVLVTRLLMSGMGTMEFLEFNEDRTATVPEYAKPGDLCFTFCPYEGMMLHSMIYAGHKEDNKFRMFCHNPWRGDSQTYVFDEACYDCGTKLEYLIFFHFNDKEDEKPDGDQQRGLLYAPSHKEQEKYDRTQAVNAAKKTYKTDVGNFRAVYTNNCIKQGGVDINCIYFSSIFYVLMDKNLGNAEVLKTNEDGTLDMPDYGKPGDVCFPFCHNEGMLVNGYIVDKEQDGRVSVYSYYPEYHGTADFGLECHSCKNCCDYVLYFSFDRKQQ